MPEPNLIRMIVVVKCVAMTKAFHQKVNAVTEESIPSEKLHCLTLLRHGESLGNAKGYYQGQADFPLTDKGIEQSHALAKLWQAEGVEFDLAISSPLRRARQTAEIIAQTLSLPLEFEPLWMERDVGQISGLSREEAAKRFPRPNFIHLYQPLGIDGESLLETYLRAGRAIQSLMIRPPGRYLIVSHGGILNMALYHILGITPLPNFQGPRFRFDNTGYATLTFEPEEHAWRLTGLFPLFPKLSAEQANLSKFPPPLPQQTTQ
ncbi:MAG: histidine phosphatase family protein [Chloroflexota bacterium]